MDCHAPDIKTGAPFYSIKKFFVFVNAFYHICSKFMKRIIDISECNKRSEVENAVFL